MPHAIHEAEHRVSVDGTLTLEHLELGSTVKVIVLPSAKRVVDPAKHQGALLRYDRPFDPVIDPQEWNAIDWRPQA